MTWITSHKAIAELRAAGIHDPMTLAIWAEQGLVSARAGYAECDGEEDRGFSEIPSEFWRYVRLGGEAYWDAGVFTAVVQHEPEHDHRLTSNHFRFSAVTFHRGELRERIKKPVSVPSQASPKRNVAEPALRRWWKDYLDKDATADAILADAKEHFVGNNVPRELMRRVRGKRPAGRRDGSLRNR